MDLPVSFHFLLQHGLIKWMQIYWQFTPFERVSIAVTRPICILEVSDLNIDRQNSYCCC
jgi:hypothetical protein